MNFANHSNLDRLRLRLQTLNGVDGLRRTTFADLCGNHSFDGFGGDGIERLHYARDEDGVGDGHGGTGVCCHSQTKYLTVKV
jgi:hypothetical protein